MTGRERGASDRGGPLRGRTLADEVVLLGRVLDELEIPAARFLGISCGGCVAAAFAAEHPERVERLAVYAAIAARLFLSPHTVHRHLANIRSKLGLSSRAAVAAYAVRHGIVR